FTGVGTIFASGTTDEKKNYQFTDNINSLNATVIYYRLRQMDIDGKAEYSAIRIIRTGKQSDNNIITVNTYPNPAGNELRITIPNNWQNKKVIFEVLNVNGQVAKKSENASSSQTENLNVSLLVRGLYFVIVSCEGQTVQQEIVKN